jgi:hypothetical protein
VGCTPKFCFIFIVVACTSCNSPQGVAEFAASAAQAVEQGPPLFRDLYGTCARAWLDRQPVEPVFKGKQPLEQPASTCARFQSEGDALIADSATLGAYFNAIHDLAAFNTSSAKAPSTTAAAQAASTANLTVSQVNAIGKLGGLVTDAATGHYQRSHLSRYLKEANTSVIDAVQAFETVARDYEGMLDEERRAVRARYQDASGAADTAVVLLLNHAYAEDMNDLGRRKAAADAYIAALEQVSEGHQKLASSNARKWGPALEPYTSKLKKLVPQMQKGF